MHALAIAIAYYYRQFNSAVLSIIARTYVGLRWPFQLFNNLQYISHSHQKLQSGKGNNFLDTSFCCRQARGGIQC